MNFSQLNFGYVQGPLTPGVRTQVPPQLTTPRYCENNISTFACQLDNPVVEHRLCAYRVRNIFSTTTQHQEDEDIVPCVRDIRAEIRILRVAFPTAAFRFLSAIPRLILSTRHSSWLAAVHIYVIRMEIPHTHTLRVLEE